MIYVDPEVKAAILYEIADARRRWSNLRKSAADDALGYGARHIDRVRAADARREAERLWMLLHDLDDIARRQLDLLIPNGAAA